MDPFEQGYFLFLKTAGFAGFAGNGDDLKNTIRAVKGEQTDSQMALHGLGLGVGLAHAPVTADQLLGLKRIPPDSGAGVLEGLKNVYTGKRLPQVAMEDGLPVEDLVDLVQGQGRRGKVLSRALSDLPQHLRRHPGTALLGLLGAAATGHAAYNVGKGVMERNAEPDYTPALMAAGGLGALGAGAAGLHHANERGMLPRVRLDVEMPEHLKHAGLLDKITRPDRFIRNKVRSSPLPSEAPEFKRQAAQPAWASNESYWS